MKNKAYIRPQVEQMLLAATAAILSVSSTLEVEQLNYDYAQPGEQL